jgi:hypothetical protein
MAARALGDLSYAYGNAGRRAQISGSLVRIRYKAQAGK